MHKFRNLTIRRKVVGAFAFALLVTIVLGAFSLQRLGAVNDRAADMRDNWLVATRSLGDFAFTTMRYRQLQATHVMASTAEDKRKEEETMRSVLDEADAAWKAYARTVTPGEEATLANEIDTGWKHYLEMNQAFLALSERGGTDAVNFYRGDMRKTYNGFHDALQRDLNVNAKGGAEAANEGAQIYQSAKMWILGALCLAAVLCISAGFLIVANVSRPIRQMTDAMARLAAHDLAVEIDGTRRGDEIGQMAAAVQVFKDSMITADRLAEEQRAEQAAKEARQQHVEHLIQGFDQSVREMLDMLASAATEMSSTAESMASIAEETSRQAVIVSSASEQASANVQTVAAASEEMTAAIAEISRQVTHSNETASAAVTEASRANSTMQGLADAAQKIGEVVALITDIAGQTNLLALNATIEAARAGEAGKGFAVVASEVKALASQTGKATGDISSQIASIQGAASLAVDAIREIDATIVRINDVSATIASAIEEQGAATKEISRNTQEASAGTQEVSRNITGVSEAAAQTGAAASQVLAASGELGRQSEKLRAEVGQFLAEIRAA